MVASGSQPSGLPWNAIRRKAPKNILLQASENPSTAEDLSMELGIALPYMEEELALLVQATLLKKEGPRYVTDFVILDSECQQELYKTQRRRSKERSALIDRLADALLPKVRELNAVRNDMTDSDVKWWLVLRILDYCIVQGKHFNENWPKERENGETWGIVGYEQTELPESLLSGHNGFGPMHATFWTYKISDYNMWERCGEMTYDEVFLLADLIRSSRRLTELKGLETELWQHIEGRFAHTGTDGSVIPDILVFEPGTQRALYTALREHALYGELKAELEDVVRRSAEPSEKPRRHGTARTAYLLHFQHHVQSAHDDNSRRSGERKAHRSRRSVAEHGRDVAGTDKVIQRRAAQHLCRRRIFGKYASRQAEGYLTAAL